MMTLRRIFSSLLMCVIVGLTTVFLLYPAWTIIALISDPQLRETGESRYVPYWFNAATPRFTAWADGYLASDVAASLHHNDVAATEWPMFGSVFYLVTAEELHRQGKIDARQDAIREAVEKAAMIVASPVTATWVKTKWGDTYLHAENVFYRMLLILGLTSYERLTGDRRYHDVMSEQRSSLAAELTAAPLHMRDDYPGECYPTDVLWAVAAIQRAARLDNTNHNALAAGLMAALNGPLKAQEGLPAFQVDSNSGTIIQGARGCGNSGILLFAAELDPDVARAWYRAYEAGFWKENRWAVGFMETPRGEDPGFMDVDSGPVVWGFGSVASAFGIGAAKTVGRFDHAAPLTLEAVACAWPTPFGFMIPGIMGKLAADSWSLGEVALLFSMTRPTYGSETMAFEGRVPSVVWVLLSLYLGVGAFLIAIEVRSFITTRACKPEHTSRSEAK